MSMTPTARIVLSRGFTLVEIMVVVVILGLLAAIVVPNVMSRLDQAKSEKAKIDIRALESALNMYKIDNYNYPATDQGLHALVEKPPEAKNWKQYVEHMPKDPWGNDYRYLYPGAHKDYDLFTLGADNQEGGDGVNADIGNWNVE
jgi:general secretion pathway protein G